MDLENDDQRLIRASLGTAAVLGLTKCKLKVEPKTAYLMTYSYKGCTANCTFCAQARSSSVKRNLLSRVVWPTYLESEVLERLSNTLFRRICIQVLTYPEFFQDLIHLISQLKARTKIPISTSCQPLAEQSLWKLKALGLDTIAIPIDAATPDLFSQVKGVSVGTSFKWKDHLEALRTAVSVFGSKKVYTHLIVGLGEKEREATDFIQLMSDLGVETGLFAFTPLKGTMLEERPPPPIESYRRLQLARHLLVNHLIKIENISFDKEGRIVDFGLEERWLSRLIASGAPFETSGCPNCNRPYYNESPRGPIYNYPYPPSQKELYQIRRQFQL